MMSKKGSFYLSCNLEKFGFEITFNEKDETILHFDGPKKTRKCATPAFLMAMFIKEHIKAIKLETGIKPEKLTCLVDECSNAQKQKIKQLWHTRGSNLPILPPWQKRSPLDHESLTKAYL